jgi:hypothetical protein
MSKQLVILCSIPIIIILFSISYYLIRKKIRENLAKKFEINDLVKITTFNHDLDPKKFYPVVGWNSYYFFIDNDDTTYRCEWGDLVINKSLEWRTHFLECEKFMGKTPGFNAELGGYMTSNKNFHNVSINLMNETQCHTYLKLAIDEENFEASELIKKRLENFR